MGDQRIYVLEGARIRSLTDLYRAMGEAVSGPGGYFGGNLDAFRDCLSGGFGTPEGGFTVEWRDSAVSRAALDRPLRRGGPTEFAALMEIFGEARGWGVELVLK